MKGNSRTAKSVKNGTVALTFSLLNLLLQFFSRKIFLEQLGTEILGLNTTLGNLLQFLNLAELGIGTAIACTLYKPLADRDTESVNEIVSLQGWMYRRIAYVVGAGAVILMGFFPWIFEKMALPLWYAYASFGVLLISALLSYFVNYKQILLSADQKEYKIVYSYRSVILLKIIFQIFTVKYLQHGYIWWLVLELIFACIASYVLSATIRKSYPELHTRLSDGRTLSRKYPDILTKIKQLFFHKISGFALNQTSPIIIYIYASLTLVALYGNYMLVITGVTVLMTAVFNGTDAGIGNLVAQGEKQRIITVFEEFFTMRFLSTCIVCFGVYTLTPSFITLWIGKEYVLNNTVLFLMTAIMYVNLSRTTVDAYLNAYGLFRDIWAPLTEAVINVGFSLLLGRFFGLVGILSGVLLSLLSIVFCWKPYFLFREGFALPFRKYVHMYLRHLIAAAGAYLPTRYIISQLPIFPADSFLQWGICALIYPIIFILFLAAFLYILTAGMRSFINRLKYFVA